jgi:hypothetical protein
MKEIGTISFVPMKYNESKFIIHSLSHLETFEHYIWENSWLQTEVYVFFQGSE